MIDGESKKRESKTVWTYKGKELLLRNGDYKTFYLPAGTITRDELKALKEFIEDVELEEEVMREHLTKPCGLPDDHKPTIIERIFGE